MMTHDLNALATSAHADETASSLESRPLSFGVALVGFVLSTALTSTVMVLLAQ